VFRRLESMSNKELGGYMEKKKKNPETHAICIIVCTEVSEMV